MCFMGSGIVRGIDCGVPNAQVKLLTRLVVGQGLP